MVLAGVVVVALGILFLLTAMALAASGQLDRPRRTVLVLSSLVVLGTGLLFLE